MFHAEEWATVTLVPDPSFIAKTKLAEQGAGVLDMIKIKALTKELCPDDQEDRSLCPVRALRYYLKNTENIRGDRKKLFVSYKKGYDKEICMNTVSSWIKKTVVKAYEDSTDFDHRVTKVKAHQVRGMAASLALHSNASMEDIMTACSWKSPSTFARFYLKDIALQHQDVSYLGPVVAAGHICS